MKRICVRSIFEEEKYLTFSYIFLRSWYIFTSPLPISIHTCMIWIFFSYIYSSRAWMCFVWIREHVHDVMDIFVHVCYKKYCECTTHMYVVYIGNTRTWIVFVFLSQREETGIHNLKVFLFDVCAWYIYFFSGCHCCCCYFMYIMCTLPFTKVSSPTQIKIG